MPRLAKQTKAAITRKNNLVPKKVKLPWRKDDRKVLLSQDKINLLDHKAKYKFWIGGKGGGKSRPVIVDEMTAMECDKHAQGLSLKKYKLAAASRLHTAINNIALEMRAKGFDVPEYEKGASETFRMINKRTKQLNQTIEYGSFDDANGLAGIEAKNLGWFAVVHIEEPVLIDDEGKLPSEKEWDAAMKTIEDSVNRSNTRHMLAYSRQIPDTKYHFTMNPWDDHPIIDRAEDKFPEEDYFNWIKKDLFKNHTKGIYDEATDSLYIRLTKFSNPINNIIERTLHNFKIINSKQWEEFDKSKIDWSADVFTEEGITEYLVTNHLKDNGGSIYHKAKIAIKQKNSLELARILGLKYEGSAGNKKTYNLDNMKTANTIELVKEADKLFGVSLAWDIDLREGRRIVCTPSYIIGNKNGVERNWKVNGLIGRQRSFVAHGDSKELHALYVKQMKLIQEEIRDEVIVASGKSKYDLGTFLYFDENKLNFILKMSDQLGWINAIGKAKKHGIWDIKNRQDNLQLGFDTGFYIMDEENVALISKLRKSIIKEGSKKRDESGKLEKEYDEINSMEYSLYPWRMQMHIPGQIIGDPIKRKEE